MPLTLEFYGNEWKLFGILQPVDQRGSITDNKPNGQRDIYIFECSMDDSQSTVYRAETVVADIERGNTRVIATTGLSIVAELRRGDNPYEMVVTCHKNKPPRRIRFTHV